MRPLSLLLHSFGLLFLLSPAAAQPSTSPDSLEAIRREAARWEYRYETLLRRRAPSRMGGASGDCDEVIGRFCFYFTPNEDPEPPAPEHPDIGRARERAIAAHRAWFALEPSNPDAAAPLLRYLVEDGRSAEAAAAGRTHAWAADGNAESLLLLGLALHHAADFAAAEATFDQARAALTAGERDELDGVDVLLDPGERRLYRALSAADRETYHRRLWAFSDPSFRIAGNERRSAHYARRVWARILEEAPTVRGRVSWGRDTEEILIRYGRPTSRERILEPLWRIGTELSMVEAFDSRAVSFVPPALLSRGLPPSPVPGTGPPLERDTVRSSYAPIGVERTRGLTVQAARFQDGGGATLRIAAALSHDTTAPAPRGPAGLLVLLDTLGTEVRRAAVEAQIQGDGTVIVRASVQAPPGAYVYRIEVADEGAALLGLAQHPIAVPVPTPPGLSDLALATTTNALPDARSDLQLSPRLVFAAGERLLVWSEAAGLARRGGEARFSVEWWIEPVRDPGVLRRAIDWLGERLGLAGDEPVRVRWDGSSTDRPVPLGFTLDLDGLDQGLYRLSLVLTDQVTGRKARSNRLLRVEGARRSRR